MINCQEILQIIFDYNANDIIKLIKKYGYLIGERITYTTDSDIYKKICDKPCYICNIYDSINHTEQFFKIKIYNILFHVKLDITCGIVTIINNPKKELHYRFQINTDSFGGIFTYEHYITKKYNNLYAHNSSCGSYLEIKSKFSFGKLALCGEYFAVECLEDINCEYLYINASIIKIIGKLFVDRLIIKKGIMKGLIDCNTLIVSKNVKGKFYSKKVILQTKKKSTIMYNGILKLINF